MASQKRQMWVILAVVFLGFFGTSMPYLLFPSIFLNPDISILPIETSGSTRALLLGITLAAYPLGQFIGSPILGALSDQKGRRKVLTVSLLFASFASGITALSLLMNNLILLISSRLLAGFMEGNVAISRAMATELKSIPKEKSLGHINAWSSIAYLIGPICGALLNQYGLATPFFVTCFLFILVALFSAALLPRSLGLMQKRAPLFKRCVTLFSNRSLRVPLLAATLFTLAVDIFYEFGPIHLTVKWMLEPLQLAIYGGMLCLGLFVGNGFLPSLLSKRAPKKLLIYGGALLYTLLMVRVAFSNSNWMMIAYFTIAGLAIGLVLTLLTVEISDAASQEMQGEAMGVQQSLRVFGEAMICLFGGGLLVFSSKIILIVAAILAFCSVIYHKKSTDTLPQEI